MCIVEVEEIVEAGALDPDHIHLPACYVHRVVKGEHFEKRIEHRTVHSEKSGCQVSGKDKVARERIVRRAAKEIKNGMFVNLGVGLPTYCANYLPAGLDVLF